MTTRTSWGLTLCASCPNLTMPKSTFQQLLGNRARLKLASCVSMHACRPDKYVGDLESWDRAERGLEAALKGAGYSHYEVDEGGGAFYGPKIDVAVGHAPDSRQTAGSAPPTTPSLHPFVVSAG